MGCMNKANKGNATVCSLTITLAFCYFILLILWSESVNMPVDLNLRCPSRNVRKRTFGHVRPITKTYLYNVNPLKPHFYIVKLGLTGAYIIVHISAQNINCGYSLELPRRGGSNEYPQSMFRAEMWKNYPNIYLKIFIFLW